MSFEDVVTQIEQGNALDIPHHNAERYPNQRLFIVAIENYAYVVPYVEDNDVVFLKTLYPSRKAVRDYFPLLGGDYGSIRILTCTTSPLKKAKGAPLPMTKRS